MLFLKDLKRPLPAIHVGYIRLSFLNKHHKWCKVLTASLLNICHFVISIERPKIFSLKMDFV